VSAPPRTYATAPGARDSITISDRASVVLAPSSKLVASNSEARLTGRAYFIVRHDASSPFTVLAGAVTIRDVGTRFVVDNVGDSAVRVVVADGSVDVALGTARERLAAGDVAGVRDGRVTVERGAATGDDLAWTKGEVVFRDAPLTAVAADLHRWYGVDIQVRDSSLAQRHFTGTFANEPVSRVLDALSLALGARVERRGDTAFIGSARAPR
jgi:transmembrane sensor